MEAQKQPKSAMLFVGLGLIAFSLITFAIGGGVFTANRAVTPFFNYLGIVCFFGWWIPGILAIAVFYRLLGSRIELKLFRVFLAVVLFVGMFFVSWALLFAFANTRLGYRTGKFIDKMMYAEAPE